MINFVLLIICLYFFICELNWYNQLCVINYILLYNYIHICISLIYWADIPPLTTHYSRIDNWDFFWLALIICTNCFTELWLLHQDGCTHIYVNRICWYLKYSIILNTFVVKYIYYYNVLLIFIRYYSYLFIYFIKKQVLYIIIVTSQTESKLIQFIIDLKFI